MDFDRSWGSGAISDPSADRYTNELQVQGKALDGALEWILGGYIERDRPIRDTDEDFFIQFGLSRPRTIASSVHRNISARLRPAPSSSRSPAAS
ncbi:MAG: hypothetical protein ABW039_11530 [Sphingobium sp.]